MDDTTKIEASKMPEIDFSSWPLWLVIAWLVLRTYRDQIGAIFPFLGSLLGARIATQQAESESRRKREEIEAEGERQDEVALWASMVRLQTEAIRQNEKLLDFIIKKLDERLGEVGEVIKQELGAVVHELSDISNRWLVASKESSNSRNEVHLLRNEVVRLVDRMQEIELHIAALTAPGQGGDK